MYSDEKNPWKCKTCVYRTTRTVSCDRYSFCGVGEDPSKCVYREQWKEGYLAAKKEHEFTEEEKDLIRHLSEQIHFFWGFFHERDEKALESLKKKILGE